jgi:hypothetical protein
MVCGEQIEITALKGTDLFTDTMVNLKQNSNFIHGNTLKRLESNKLQTEAISERAPIILAFFWEKKVQLYVCITGCLWLSCGQNWSFV